MNLKRLIMKSRPLVSWIVTWSFLIMTWTGIVLFFAPKGRVAKWVEWEFTGLTKGQYENLHITFMVLFVIGIGIHIYLNWKPLMNYIRNKQRKINLTNRNFWVSTLISAVFVFGTLALVPPFSSFLYLQEDLKAYWEKTDVVAPYGHAELSSLTELSNRMGWDSEKTFTTYEKLGYILSSRDATLGELAKLNKTTPQEIFTNLSKALNGRSSSSMSTSGGGSGGGFGRLTLEQASIQEGFDLDGAIKYLNTQGVNVKRNDSLRPIAEDLGVSPRELAATLKRL